MTSTTNVYHGSLPIKLDSYLTEGDLAALASVNKKSEQMYGFRVNRGLSEHTTISGLCSAIWPRSKTSEEERKLQAEFSSLAKRFYEIEPRGVGNNNYGKAFSIYPEILERAIGLSKGKLVLEIAGAGGENAALLAFGGARSVYVNDICPKEMKRFHEMTSKLPDSVSNKLVGVQGSCFDILRKHPELEGNVGFILCRNFLHFVHPQEESKFLHLIKRLLGPGGQAVFTVTGSYGIKGAETGVQQSPDCAFAMRYCSMHEYQLGLNKVISQDMSPISSFPSVSSLFTDFKKVSLYEKNSKTSYEWRRNDAAFRQLDDSLRKKFEEAISSVGGPLELFSRGSVRVVTTHVRFFNFQKLLAIFRREGFFVESSFSLGGRRNGHIERAENIKSQNSCQVGVIVRRESNLGGLRGISPSFGLKHT